MNITREKLNSFYDMVRDFVNRHDLVMSMETTGLATGKDPVSNLTISNEIKDRRYIVYWSEVKSLTEAATPIFADVLVYFGIQKSDTDTTSIFDISNVIFNGPATIVLWKDGTKTVVKCQDGDCYSEETGLALCFMKKALGNKPNFNDVFRKWIPDQDYSRSLEDIFKALFTGSNLK